jgi:sulfur-oxidizing protein SoxZ
MAASRVQVPAEVRRGDSVEVKISIRHPMETGFRVDDSGRRIARNTIREFTCRYNGKPVFVARLGSGIAANPYLRFFLTAAESGQLSFEWVDEAGERGDALASLTVVG